MDDCEALLYEFVQTSSNLSSFLSFLIFALSAWLCDQCRSLIMESVLATAREDERFEVEKESVASASSAPPGSVWTTATDPTASPCQYDATPEYTEAGEHNGELRGGVSNSRRIKHQTIKTTPCVDEKHDGEFSYTDLDATY